MSPAPLPAAELTPGLRRAAVALVALGKDHAAKVLAHMEPEEVAALSRAVLQVGAIPATEVRASLSDLASSMGQLSALSAPNHAWLAETLTAALGPADGPALLAEITRPAPFAWAETTDRDTLARVLEDESPASVAIALSHLSPELGAALLKRLSPAKRASVATRVAVLDGVTETVVRDVDAALLEQVGSDKTVAKLPVDGVETLTALLARSPRSTTDAVLAQLDVTDPAMAAKVREAMFTFEDVLALETRAVMAVVNKVDVAALAVALFGADEQTVETVFAAVTERKGAILREEVESLSTVRTAEVRAARAQVVATALELEAEGAIAIERGSDEEDA